MLEGDQKTRSGAIPRRQSPEQDGATWAIIPSAAAQAGSGMKRTRLELLRPPLLHQGFKVLQLDATPLVAIVQ